ncbi:MAG: CHRD domain-containing protein [Trueperaceae bacterium]|nr:MAG: CHRD domain-containing protein [Trueperaceae bacterium]
MRKYVLLFGLLSILITIVGSFAFAQSKLLPFTFTATLSSDQLVNPVETDGAGTVIAVLLGNQLVVTGSYQNLRSPVNTAVAGGANVRMAPPGEDGQGVRLEAEQPFFGSGKSMGLKTDGGRSGTFSGVFVLNDEQIEALGDGLFYVQLYTIRNSSGELRGQLSQDTSGIFDAFREYLAALDDPDVVHDATAADMVGIWRDTTTNNLFQDYEDGTWTILGSLADVGTIDNYRWKFEDNARSVDWGSGSQVELTLLYKDGRRRYIVVEAQGQYTEPFGVWYEQVLIDEQGNRVNRRQ